LAGHYREQGYEFFALTDHNRYYPGGEIDEVYEGVRTGLTRIPGEEVHTPGSMIHIVHVGGKSSVAAQYVKDTAGYAEAVARDYLPKVPETVPEVYRERYAMATWACDRIHEAGGLAIFAHPYWKPGDRVYNVQDRLAQIFLQSGLFDAYELAGCMGQVGTNRSVALWSEARAQGVTIPVVGSSDVHAIEGGDTFPHYFTVCFAQSNEPAAILDAIRAGLSVAVEAQGSDYDRQYRCYGSLRLVSYATFLLHYYYPQLQRICGGIGVAMRAYAMGEAGADVIELQNELAENYRLRYFGQLSPVLPDAAMLNFEAKWRAVQEAGPITKGSSIASATVTRQI
jgi:hypothetical protein